MATKSVSLFGRVSYRPIAYRPVVPYSCIPNGFSPRGPSNMATMATYKVPKVENENNVSVNHFMETIC